MMQYQAKGGICMLSLPIRVQKLRFVHRQYYNNIVNRIEFFKAGTIGFMAVTSLFS